jgi:hypothetical protein
MTTALAHERQGSLGAQSGQAIVSAQPPPPPSDLPEPRIATSRGRDGASNRL